MTDESNVYSHAGTWYASQETVNHSAKEYVRDDVFTNTVEGFFSILKRGVYGVYFHVSEAHLHRFWPSSISATRTTPKSGSMTRNAPPSFWMGSKANG
jgi:hypothetical protein